MAVNAELHHSGETRITTDTKDEFIEALMNARADGASIRIITGEGNGRVLGVTYPGADVDTGVSEPAELTAEQEASLSAQVAAEELRIANDFKDPNDAEAATGARDSAGVPETGGDDAGQPDPEFDAWVRDASIATIEHHIDLGEITAEDVVAAELRNATEDTPARKGILALAPHTTED